MLFLLGPLMWLVSLLVVAYVIGHDDAIGIALLVLAGVARDRARSGGLDADCPRARGARGVNLEFVVVALLVFVGFYPIVSSAFWIAGGLLFRLFDEAGPTGARRRAAGPE